MCSSRRNQTAIRNFDSSNSSFGIATDGLVPELRPPLCSLGC
jgi:hypothetical protein